MSKIQSGSDVANEINKLTQFLTSDFVMLVGEDFSKKQKKTMTDAKIHVILDYLIEKYGTMPKRHG